MQSIIFQVWSNYLVFFFSISVLPGVSFNKGMEGFLVSGTLYVFLIFLLPKIIEFFKINVNFWSFLVFGMIASIGYFYFMRFIFTNFLIFEAVSSSEAILELTFFRGIEMGLSQITVFAGIFTMLIVAINQALFERS